MLHNLRAASETWVGRIVATLIMGFIVFSFAIFGIEDMVRTIGTGGPMASVGGSEIPPETFRAAYERQLNGAGQRLGRRITNEEARAAGLDKQLLDQLINELAFDQRTRALGLAASDELIRARIEANPNFSGPGGKFNPQRLAEALRENGLTANGFVAEQRKALLRQQVAEAVGGGLAPPQALLEAYNRSRNETRAVEYVVLPDAAAGEIAAPSAEELGKYFSARAENYQAPEYRKLAILALRPDALAKPEAVAEADARKRYDETKLARHTVPEKRTIRQLSFPDEAAARAASDKLKAGATFDAIAAERQLTDKDLDLGTITRDGLPGDVGKAAFELAEGGVSDPVQNLVGYSIVQAAKVFPAFTTPFEALANAIKAELAQTAARKELQGLHDKIEDARAGGKALAEAAKAAGLEVRVIEAVDAAGRGKDGAPLADLPEAAALLRAAFASDVGVDNDIVQTRDRGYVWFEVAGVEPRRPRTLEEMRAAVEANWRADETARRLAAKAAELVKKLNGGAAIADIAAAEGKLEVKSLSDARREGAKGLPPGVAAQIFNVPVKGAGSGSAPGGRIVFVVNDSAVQPLDLASAETKELEGRLRGGLSEDLLQQYVTQARNEAGVKINQPLLRQIVGGGGDGAP